MIHHQNETTHWRRGQDNETNDNNNVEYEIISKDLVTQMREIDAVLKREVDFLETKPTTAREDDYSVNRELTKLDLSQALLNQELDSCAVPSLISCSSSLSSSSLSSSSSLPEFVEATDCQKVPFPSGKDDATTNTRTATTMITTTAIASSPYTSSIDTINIPASQIHGRRLRLRLRLRLLVFSLLILISILVLFMLALAVATLLWVALVWFVMNYGS